MKGIVFNLLEQVVVDAYGIKTWEALLETSGLEGAYTAVGSYADQDLVKLVSAASEALKITADEVVRWFGASSIPLLFERYPHFFKGHTSTKSFVLTLNDVIHPEVRKLFPGADVPVFDFEHLEGDRLAIGYMSHRKLCAFAEGLIGGAAAQFGETATVEQTECMNRGDPKCLFVCSFEKLAA